MTQISPAFKAFLDRTLPKPIIGPGFQLQIGVRSAVRYTEKSKQITLFDDIIPRTDEAWHGGFLGKLFSKWCLGVYIEEPLVWDNETTPIPADYAKLILQRIEDALKQRSGCYRIERGPSRQHSHSSTP